MKELLKSSFFLMCLISYSNRIFSQDLDTAKCILNEAPFSSVEKMPVFPGGEAAMDAFIKSNLVYPESAKREMAEGTVITQFIVDPDGKVICPKIILGISKDCDREVLRLLYNFPKWQAGMHNGKSVNVSFTLPFKFTL